MASEGIPTMQGDVGQIVERRKRAFYTAARILLVQRDSASASFQVALAQLRPAAATVEAVEAAYYTQLQRQNGPWSIALVEQLLAGLRPVAQLADVRPTLLNDEWKKLTTNEQELLRHVYDERFPVAASANAHQQTPTHWLRELTMVHVTLFDRLQHALPDEVMAWPSNRVELTRLILCVSQQYEADDAKLVLESLLLGDPAAQAYYLRMVALITELDARFHDLPPTPEMRALLPPARAARRERYVTIGFVIACLATIIYIVWLLVR